MLFVWLRVKVLVEAYTPERYGYTNVTFEAAELKFKTVNIYVKDACSREIVAGAQVWVDNVLRGFTGSDGKIYVGYLTTGNHSIRVVKTGYFNLVDTFTVPEQASEAVDQFVTITRS